MIEILTGERPKALLYSIVRKGHGIPIKRRRASPILILDICLKTRWRNPCPRPYNEEEQNKPISLSYHKGQEFDYILKGSPEGGYGKHIEILHEGDAIFL